MVKVFGILKKIYWMGRYRSTKKGKLEAEKAGLLIKNKKNYNRFLLFLTSTKS